MNIDSILKKWFSDYVNPTDDELEEWMKDPESFEPMQDWDLIVGSECRLPALTRLACNHGPQRAYILHCLYISTAYAFNSDRNKISSAIALVPNDAYDDVLRWSEKAKYLLENPTSYREKEWFNYIYSIPR